MSNKLLLAGAGTGKTTYIVEQALKETKRILITTFTIKCRDEIKDKLIKKKGYIPKNIIVQTWFSFLLEHGILPYKKDLEIKEINGINFVEGKSGLKYISKNGIPVYYGEKDFNKYYFDSHNRIYTDKLAKLVLKINEASVGLSFRRIESVFDKIFIDEVQDMVGYDLEIIKQFAELGNNLVIVGDPRQNIYNTHCDSKYDKYSNGRIDEFITNECKGFNFDIDNNSLNICRRCHKDIVDFLNDFYCDYDKLGCIDIPINKSQGIFVVKTQDLDKYLKIYKPMQLRYNKKVRVNADYKSVNYRNSKGCTYNRTIIYPTNDLKTYLKTGKEINKISTKNAIYVALSRAVDSVAIVYDGSICKGLKIKLWNED